jgi:hypothetical protein
MRLIICGNKEVLEVVETELLTSTEKFRCPLECRSGRYVVGCRCNTRGDLTAKIDFSVRMSSRTKTFFEEKINFQKDERKSSILLSWMDVVLWSCTQNNY